jgi:short subunit fatty acids transporter
LAGSMVVNVSILLICSSTVILNIWFSGFWSIFWLTFRLQWTQLILTTAQHLIYSPNSSHFSMCKKSFSPFDQLFNLIFTYPTLQLALM